MTKTTIPQIPSKTPAAQLYIRLDARTAIAQPISIMMRILPFFGLNFSYIAATTASDRPSAHRVTVRMTPATAVGMPYPSGAISVAKPRIR